MNLSPESAIAFFDSGVGGFSVMREAMRLLPSENMIYLGDCARLPYGNKSPETIAHATHQCASFLAKQNIKFLVIACFTASIHALASLQQTLAIPCMGVIHSALDALYAKASNKKISLLGTQSTLQSGLLQSHLRAKDPQLQIFPIACPLFVPLVEEGFANHPAAKLIIERYLRPLKGKNIDALLLACTHYPFLRKAIQAVIGPTVALIDPSRHTALELRRQLSARGLLNPQKEPGLCRLYTTDNSETFHQTACRFLRTKKTALTPMHIPFPCENPGLKAWDCVGLGGASNPSQPVFEKPRP